MHAWDAVLWGGLTSCQQVGSPSFRKLAQVRSQRSMVTTTEGFVLILSDSLGSGVLGYILVRPYPICKLHKAESKEL